MMNNITIAEFNEKLRAWIIDQHVSTQELLNTSCYVYEAGPCIKKTSPTGQYITKFIKNIYPENVQVISESTSTLSSSKYLEPTYDTSWISLGYTGVKVVGIISLVGAGFIMGGPRVSTAVAVLSCMSDYYINGSIVGCISILEVIGINWLKRQLMGQQLMVMEQQPMEENGQLIEQLQFMGQRFIEHLPFIKHMVQRLAEVQQLQTQNQQLQVQKQQLMKQNRELNEKLNEKLNEESSEESSEVNGEFNEGPVGEGVIQDKLEKQYYEQLKVQNQQYVETCKLQEGFIEQLTLEKQQLMKRNEELNKGFTEKLAKQDKVWEQNYKKLEKKKDEQLIKRQEILKQAIKENQQFLKENEKIKKIEEENQQLKNELLRKQQIINEYQRTLSQDQQFLETNNQLIEQLKEKQQEIEQLKEKQQEIEELAVKQIKELKLENQQLRNPNEQLFTEQQEGIKELEKEQLKIEKLEQRVIEQHSSISRLECQNQQFQEFIINKVKVKRRFTGSFELKLENQQSTNTEKPEIKQELKGNFEIVNEFTLENQQLTLENQQLTLGNQHSCSRSEHKLDWQNVNEVNGGSEEKNSMVGGSNVNEEGKNNIIGESVNKDVQVCDLFD